MSREMCGGTESSRGDPGLVGNPSITERVPLPPEGGVPSLHRNAAFGRRPPEIRHRCHITFGGKNYLGNPDNNSMFELEGHELFLQKSWRIK